MKQYNLGPNGGILTSCNLFATRFDQVRFFQNLPEPRAIYTYISTGLDTNLILNKCTYPNGLSAEWGKEREGSMSCMGATQTTHQHSLELIKFMEIIRCTIMYGVCKWFRPTLSSSYHVCFS